MPSTPPRAHRGIRLSAALAAGLGVALTLCLSLLAACGSTADAYGGSLNHVHDMLALRDAPHTVLLATHIGLYRTTNDGASWTEVAGGSGQIMDGLMLFRLAQSPIDPARIYVLAIPRTGRIGDAPATPGMYTSADFGKTWKLATAETSLPTHAVFTIGTGSLSAGTVYTLIPALAQNGLYVTRDYGAHWNALPALPDSHPTGVVGDPNHPGHVFLWSASTGLYISDDAGQTWNAVSDVQGGIFSVSIAGTHIYASGDAGTYLSTDDGAHFSLVNPNYTFSAVVSSLAAPSDAYAMTGTSVYATGDNGTTWHQAAPTSNHPGNITVDPANPQIIFTAFSYPVGVQVSTDGGAHWKTVLP
jgi:BNR/Asp-box repeat